MIPLVSVKKFTRNRRFLTFEKILKGTVMKIEKALINDRLRVSRGS